MKANGRGGGGRSGAGHKNRDFFHIQFRTSVDCILQTVVVSLRFG